MNLLLSAVLLGSFVVGVDMLLGDGVGFPMGVDGLFHRDGPDWPAGVQEGGPGMWLWPASAPGWAGEQERGCEVPPAPPVPEIVEDGVAPVAVSLVRPHRRPGRRRA